MKKIKHVTIFAGAHANKKYLKLAYNLGKKLAENGFIVITGGGPGMMGEVCRGAFEYGGKTYGICISYGEEKASKYLTYKKIVKSFDERHRQLIKKSDAFLALPGGLGTILEILEITQKKKFKEIPTKTPMVMVGDYFQKLIKLIEKVKQEGFIAEELNNLYSFAETPEKVIKILKN